MNSGHQNADAKKEIRKRIILQRNALDSNEISKKSEIIFGKIIELSHYKKAKTVMAYMDFRNEAATGDFIKRCKMDGKAVVLPKVEVCYPSLITGNAMSIYEINDIELDIILGFKGIPEPNSAALSKADPLKIDLAVIPGVAFDYNRYRIGYGAGYYDRFLPELRHDCLKAGAAFSLQLVEAVPAGAHDIPMDIVITEDRII